MRQGKEEAICSIEQGIDLITVVKEVHGLNSQELNKLLRDSENFTVHFVTEKGLEVKIDVEKLAGFLPLHLIAVLLSSDRDEALLRYLLCGIRLLHSLCELAPRHAKLEQILLDDVKVSEQLIDLVFYVLIVLNDYRQDIHDSSPLPLLHSALVACSLYLLTGCISSQWQDLALVILAHPKVDMFMDVACKTVHLVVRFLQNKLSSQHTDICAKSSPTSESMVNYLCQQCEASLQFLQLLCQQKLFRECLLRNKELCRKGGILFLAQSILKLHAPYFVESSTIMAALSRLKAKVLSILLHLCEAESISYLDEVASSPGSLDLAKAVALEVLQLLKTGLSKDPKHLSASSDRTYPMGLLQLNAMRLADIFSDDSNFRSCITVYFTEFLSAIFSLSHGDFLSMWCSADFPVREEDATLYYELFPAAGWALYSVSSSDLSNTKNLEFTLMPNNMSQASYAHQRTSLFVKVIANLHCFVPNICEEQERNLFLHKFLGCLQMDPSKLLPGFAFISGPQKAAAISRNLRSLLSHAESLIPTFLNEEDLKLLRVFFVQLQSLINSAEFEENRVQEDRRLRGCSSPLLKREPSNLNNQNGNLKEEMSENSAFQDEQFYVRSNHMDQADIITRQDMMDCKDKSVTPSGLKEIDRDVQNVETSGSDTSSTKGKNAIDKLVEHLRESTHAGVREDEKVETVQTEEKQPRKRKRTIMNDGQGSEVTCSQLRNWLNNRKARLARASKDSRPPPEPNNAFAGKQGGLQQGHSLNAPDSPGQETAPSNTRGTRSISRINTSENPDASEFVDFGAAEFVQCKPGQFVVLLDGRGEEIGKGKVHQVHGKWCGKSLEESVKREILSKQSIMVAKGRQNATDSLKVEVGEIDTSAPFQSVKDAVTLFGEGAFSGEKPAIKKAKAHSAETVLAKETQLHLAQKELNKLKEQLENAETTKAQALVEIERAKKMVEELTHKLKTVNESKDSAIKATEAAKNQAKQIEEANSGNLPGPDGAMSQDLETAREQYLTVITELDAAKQELRKVRQDCDASLEAKNAAFNQTEEAEHAVKVNMEKVGKLSREISAIQESIGQVKLASLESQQEQAKIFAEKDTQRQLYKATLEESTKRLLALKNEYDPELTRNLEAQLSETVNQIGALQKQMENAKASDLESVQTVTSELDGAKESLLKVAEEESSLRSLVESLKVELENVKKEHSELKEKEAETESIAGNLHVKLRKSKSELEVFLAEESKTRGACVEMISTLQQLLVETENAQREAEEMKKEAEKLKLEAESSRIALEEADKQLRVAMEEAEAAKEAETRALDQIKMLSERTNAARASTSESGANITISREEFESLSGKVEESDKLAEMKVAAALAQVEAVKASENEVRKRLEATQKEIEDMKVATADALKKAEMAEAAKRVVEGELRRWHEREQKKAAEAASRILAEAQMSAESSPQHYRIQKQNPPQKIVQARKLEKEKSSVSKKVLLPSISGIFNRRKNQIEGGSPSYLPGEKPL
ncbi:nodulin homeobox-like isoform X3 [Durio zibethinus]|uniref:Nodulin homeobox-like isoform X3 n=1 Tax=Durio zibethinus TaxID=66656 RepID=A0A6P5ZJE5_DURZI|nr:nodulin homeobox-like isoform X3 [Durio zibethinus]